MTANRVREVTDRIRRAESRFGRRPGSVQLVAVSKKKSVSDIVAAVECGQRAFGENYLQEALPKIAALAAYRLEWHFVGAIQSNKSREIAEHFGWVHTVDRLKIARRLSTQRPAGLPPLNVCIEVNISGEASKAGVGAAELPDLILAVAELPNLRLRGLMGLPAPVTGFQSQRAAFKALADLFAQAPCAAMDTLSMGTTADFEAAIAEGATIVRIGTGVFGPRD